MTRQKGWVTYTGIRRSPHFRESFRSRTEYFNVKKSIAEKAADIKGAMAQDAAIWLRLPVAQPHFNGVWAAIPAPARAPTTVCVVLFHC